MIHILITFGDRCRKIAKPASYRDLIVKARKEFPMMSSVACLVVMFYPRSTDETIPRVKMVELDSNAYGSVKDGEVLFFNVQHPITKEYILPYPDEDPNVPHQSQYHPADVERMFARSGKEMHVKVSSNSSLQPYPLYQHQDTSTFSSDAQHAGGDAFGSGWGAASDRFRRSAKLIPNLKECKDAIGLSIGQSNGYPDDQSADDWDQDAAAELQGAFDALAARPPIDAISGRHTDGAWVGSDAAKQCSQQTENVLAGGAGLDNSGMGAGTQGWGQMSASDRRDTRPACHGRLGTGPESSTSSGKTAQFPEHHDPFQPPPPPPGWPTASLTEGSNQNNDFQEFRTSQQNENVGNVSDILYSGPVYHPAAAVEWIPKFNYGRPNGQSFQKLVAPGATGPTHLVSLELREREAAIHQAKQAHQHRRMVRVSHFHSEHQPSFFDPAKSSRGSPMRKQPRAQGNASSHWATKEVHYEANDGISQIQTRDIQQQRLLLLEMADQLQRKLDLDKESHGTEAVSGAQPGAQPGSGKDAWYASDQVADY